MESALAICPICNQQITINSLEEVDFCKLCGKPFITQKGVELYKKSIERNEAAQKPSEHIIEKFNAILQQDYKLALHYLDSVVQTEYPKLKTPILPTDWEFSRYFVGNKPDYSSPWELSKYCAESRACFGSSSKLAESFKNLHSLNVYIWEMYYHAFCLQINTLYKEKYNWVLTGYLPLLKLRLCNIETQLNDFIQSIYTLKDTYYTYEYYERKEIKDSVITHWKIIEQEIKEQEYLQGKEFDDEYICHIIDLLERWKQSSVRVFYGGHHFTGFRSTRVISGEYIKYFANEYPYSDLLNLDGLVKLLMAFLSPQEKRRVEDERTKKAAYEKELAFWQHYIDLLKAGKAKEALELLKKTKKPTETSEFTNFKKGLFGVKYTGYVGSSLKAENFARPLK